MKIQRRAGLALLLLAAGCASWRMSKPEVSLTHVKPEDVGLFEQELAVGLRIYNPNDFPLEVHGIRFAIELDGKRVARGQDDTRFSIPAEGEHEIDVKARARSLAMLRQIFDAGVNLSYEVDGKLLLDNREASQVDFELTSGLDLD